MYICIYIYVELYVLIYVKYFNKNALKLFEYLCHLLNTLTKTPDALAPLDRPPLLLPTR